MNENYTIDAFTHKIADLPDQPNLSPSELKARFDACPEELRVAHNALCEDTARLGDRVDGIVAETFGGAITEPMLDPALSANMVWKSDLYLGRYTGDGEYPREIELGFAPKALLIMRADGTTGSIGYTYQFLAFPVEEPGEKDYCVLTETGFRLTNATGKSMLNSLNGHYSYIAVK